MRRTIAFAALIGVIAAVTTMVPLTSMATEQVRRADFAGEGLTADTRHVADWAVHSGDHRGLPFIVIDKVYARAAAFDAAGRLVAVTPVLIGMGVGDTIPPGVLQLDMYQTKPAQRVTPAGRFFAEEDRDLKNERVLWVDYDAGIAIHKMPTKKTSQRRAERMASPYPADHRITYGCINVPAAFYQEVVARHFRAKGGYVYVLPDTTTLQAVFNSYDVAERVAPQARVQPASFTAPPAAVRRF